MPTDAETADNPRARSAKLRAAHRLGADEAPESEGTPESELSPSMPPCLPIDDEGNEA